MLLRQKNQKPQTTSVNGRGYVITNVDKLRVSSLQKTPMTMMTILGKKPTLFAKVEEESSHSGRASWNTEVIDASF
jgi:hypothetical protein